MDNGKIVFFIENCSKIFFQKMLQNPYKTENICSCKCLYIKHTQQQTTHIYKFSVCHIPFHRFVEYQPLCIEVCV